MAIFTKPLSWLDGIRRLAARKVLPTTLGTEDLRRLGGDVKRWGIFSAKIANAEALQEINDVVTEVVRGITPKDEETFTVTQRDGTTYEKRKKPLQLSIPDAKLKLRDKFRELGVTVENPAKIGTIEDPESDARLQLIVSTQEELAQGYGKFIASQDPDLLDVWPCQELVRNSPSLVQRDWKERWERSGGKLFDGRMIALKNSDIWDRLGDSNTFPDALGNPYPPFAFNSGMGVEDVSRTEAEQLGVIERFTPTPPPRERALVEDVKASPERFDESIRVALANDPTMVLEDGVLSLRG
jgi:hypothetical protein